MVKVALLIGVSDYKPGLSLLPMAVKDVNAMQQVLQHSDIGGFAESNVTVLKNPDRQEMEEAIETLFTGRQKDDLVLLFFSGHGIKDETGRLYLATSKTRKTEQGELVRSTAVSASFIHESMARSRSKRQVVILDSCFSGAFAEGLSAKDDGSVDIQSQLGGEGRAVLTSSTSTQYSFEQQGTDLSIYTRFLVEGMATGEADQNQDGRISVDELHEYASQKVSDIQPAMKPEIYAVREGFKICIANVSPSTMKPKSDEAKEAAEQALDADILMAALQLDRIESANLLELLTQKLEQVIPENIRVIRNGWFLSKQRPVQEVTLHFDDCAYQITRERNGSLTTKHLKIVRGIVLKTTKLPANQWTQEVAQALVQLAASSEQTRLALQKFVMG